MDKIMTRWTRGVGVGVRVGVDVSVAGAVWVAVRVGGSVAVPVCVAVGGLKGAPPTPGIWQARSRRIEKIDMRSLRVLLKDIVINSLSRESCGRRAKGRG